MNVGVELVEENVPVRAFVSIVRRTKRVITNLENLLALRVRDCWGNIIGACPNITKRTWRDRGWGGVITYKHYHRDGNHDI